MKEEKRDIAKYISDIGKQDVNITPMVMPKEYLGKILEHYNSNKIIKNYYIELSNEYKDGNEHHAPNEAMMKNINNKIYRLDKCNKYWESDYYKKLNIKDYHKTYLCKDKFCLNCKKWRQAQRMKKFIPVLEKYDKDLYFVTLTIPNVFGADVKETINRIIKAHTKLVQYLDGTRESKLLNETSKVLNLIGGIRVLEISINRDINKKYHVHLHCAYIPKDYE